METDVAAALVVRRGTAAAAVWSLLGLLLTGSAILLVISAGGNLLAWLLLALSVLVTAWFVAQLLLPDAVTLALGPDGVRACTFGRRTHVGWERVHLVRVRRIAGEPVLELEVRDLSEPARVAASPPRRRVIPLPVGAELAPMHRFLEGRLGRAPYARPR